MNLRNKYEIRLLLTFIKNKDMNLPLYYKASSEIIQKSILPYSQQNSKCLWVKLLIGNYKYSRGLHVRDFLVRARPSPQGYNLDPSRLEVKKKNSAMPEREIKISARDRPGSKGKLKFLPEPGPAWNKIENFGPDPARPFFFYFVPDSLA